MVRSRPLVISLLAALTACAGPTDPADDDATDTEPVTDSDDTDDSDAADTDPTLAPVHRLSARELGHTLSDVLGVDVDPAAWLPEDPRVDGFDHLTAELVVSEDWLDALNTLAREVAARVDRPRAAVAATPRLELQGEALVWSTGVAHASTLVPFDALWAFDRTTTTRVELPEGTVYDTTLWVLGAALPGAPLTLTVSVDGEEIDQVVFAGGSQGRTSVEVGALDPGWHTLTLDVSPSDAGAPPLARDTEYIEAPFVGIDEAHFVATTAVPTPTPPTPDRVLACSDGSAVTDACADDAITRLAARVWRRPVDADDLVTLRAVYDAQREAGYTPEDALREVVVALLLSPSFVYRREWTRTDLTPDAYAIATRLSYAVWASAPDDALLTCAAQGGLQADDAGPCGLSAQLERLLAHPRAERLVDDLMLGWLGVHDVDSLWVRAPSHPRWTPELFSDLRAETRGLVRKARADELDLRDLLTVGSSAGTWRVAALYGVEPTSFSADTPFDTAALGRPGLLGQGSVLAASAEGTQPSPVDRAVWVMRTLLCQEPAQPPPNIPPLDGALDPRDALAAHVAEASCASCHATIDPLGAPLDGFDLLGAHVDADPTVTLPTGDTVDSVAAYAAWLRGRPEVTACFTRRVATWVVGRELRGTDSATLDTVRQLSDTRGFDLDTLVRTVVDSPLFVAPTGGR